jgi:hypothetical protein
MASIGVRDRPQLVRRHALRYSVAQGWKCYVIERTQENQPSCVRGPRRRSATDGIILRKAV